MVQQSFLLNTYLVKQLTTSVYSARLYELLIQWKSIGKTPILELTNFREQLGIGLDEYSRIEAFKRRVLDIALKEINEHTDITATYEQHKRASDYRFSFKFKQKKPKQAEITTETPKTATNDLDTINPLTEPQIIKYSMILCKLGSISDLSNFQTIQPLQIGLVISKKSRKSR